MSSKTFRKTLEIGAVLVFTCVLLLSSSGISAIISIYPHEASKC